MSGIDFDYVGEKLVWDRKISAEEWPRLRDEFRKFVTLVGLGVSPLAMISPKLDEVWHQFVLFTKRYEAFCNDTVGFYIHHTPETPDCPLPVEAARNLIEAYEEHFGPIPAVWIDGLEPQVRGQYAARPLLQRPSVRWSGWTGR